MLFVLDNSLILGDYQYFTTYDGRIMYRKITLDNEYDVFKELLLECNQNIQTKQLTQLEIYGIIKT